MIIFDTNVLFGLSPDDPKSDLLLALRHSGQQQVAIPWMVLEELVAQRVLRHAEAHAEAVSAGEVDIVRAIFGHAANADPDRILRIAPNMHSDKASGRRHSQDDRKIAKGPTK